MNKEIAGFFLSFSEEEMTELRRRLDILGYSVDGAGLKEYVLDCLGEEEEEVARGSSTDNLIGMAQKYIKNNPETVRMGLNAVSGLMKMIKTKKKT